MPTLECLSSGCDRFSFNDWDAADPVLIFVLFIGFGRCKTDRTACNKVRLDDDSLGQIQTKRLANPGPRRDLKQDSSFPQDLTIQRTYGCFE